MRNALYRKTKSGLPLFFPARHIAAKERTVAGFIEVAGRQSQHRLRRVFLTGGESITVEFKKQRAITPSGDSGR